MYSAAWGLGLRKRWTYMGILSVFFSLPLSPQCHYAVISIGTASLACTFHASSFEYNAPCLPRFRLSFHQLTHPGVKLRRQALVLHNFQNEDDHWAPDVAANESRIITKSRRHTSRSQLERRKAGGKSRSAIKRRCEHILKRIAVDDGNQPDKLTGESR